MGVPMVVVPRVQHASDRPNHCAISIAEPLRFIKRPVFVIRSDVMCW